MVSFRYVTTRYAINSVLVGGLCIWSLRSDGQTPTPTEQDIDFYTILGIRLTISE